MSSQHSTSVDCTTIADLIPDYAFGLASEAERRLVEAHLAGCPEAAAQLTEFRQMQDDLRMSVPVIVPPPGLEARLMAAVDKSTPEAQRTQIEDDLRIHPGMKDLTAKAQYPSRLASSPPGTQRTPIAQDFDPPSHREASLRRQARHVFQSRAASRARPIWWMAAAGVAAALLIVSNLVWAARLNQTQAQLDQITALLPADLNQLARAFVLTNGDNLRWVWLRTGEEGSRTAALMMWDEQTRTGLLCAWGFPELAPGERYQLWLTPPEGDSLEPVGNFGVNERGSGALVFTSSADIDQFIWARVTTEPESGSAQPSDLMIVNGEIS
jgi:anti-sigma factor RsiW